MTLIGVDGSIDSTPADIYPRWPVQVSVTDIDEDRDSLTPDSFEVAVTNGGQTETLTVTETGNSTGVFEGSVGTVFSTVPSSGDGIVQAQAGDQIVFAYSDSLDATGSTVGRSDTTDVVGGDDGSVRATVVSQPGDTVRVRVTDADLSVSVEVTVENGRTTESESILLSAFSSGSSVYYGRFFTSAQTATPGDSTMEVAKGDTLTITYADTLTALGGTADQVDDDEVVDPFGDADGNTQVQAYDAAKVLLHCLTPYLTGVDSLSSNLDLYAFSTEAGSEGRINPYDASLILQKRVGILNRFPAQEPEADNHPQPETASRPKAIPDERLLALRPGDGYVAVWAERREGILSGSLTLSAAAGTVEMAAELSGYLSASRSQAQTLRIVFAGAVPATGPGELLRIHGMGLPEAQLVRASLNGGLLAVQTVDGDVGVRVPRQLALHPNVPNPFNPSTTISFDLPAAGYAQVEIFDVLGQQVRVLVDGELGAGFHRMEWDGRNSAGEAVANGVYLCRLTSTGRKLVQRMMLLK